MAAFAITQSGYNGPTLVAQASGVAVAAQGEISGLRWADKATVVISGLTGETVSVTGLLLGSAVYTAALRPIDLATGAVAAASALPNGSYAFRDLCLESLKFTKSSTSETPTITFMAKSRLL